MKSDELRRAWADFWRERQHTIVPSAGLIPHHPTAPMFVNSGMMQFVPYFLGEEPVPFNPPRASSIQKCVRLAGKHNDIDEVGRTRRHLTFFEMLGNWSFGDYFKREAIAWAWEFVTNVTGFDGDRIWITVHETDDEAEAIWHEEIGLPLERIQRMGKDNYWEMGETGPCGVCSEIHYDSGPEWGDEGGPKFGGEDRYVEFWNLVFMTDFRHGDGHLTELPAKNVDTGAGFERWLMLLQGGRTAFDTDIFGPLMETAQSVTGKRLGADEETDYALRVLADHARTMTFLVNDGVVPSNEDRGYVLRKVIRRAIRYAYLLGVHKPVLPSLVATTIDTMESAYPDLRANESWIASILANEEGSFRATLERGMTLLEESLAARSDVVPGEVAFRLHDTHGFPVEVTKEIADERGADVDLEGFERLMGDQRQRAKRASKNDDVYANLSSFQEVLDHFGPTDFVGREEFETKATVLAVVDDSVFLDRSPFYAESGGQVGDTGTITTDTGRAEVIDTTFAMPGLHRHVVRVVEARSPPGKKPRRPSTSPTRRDPTQPHGHAHPALGASAVLGDHVKQQGSLVAPDRLRFDFGPADAVTPEQIREIEDLANAEILSNDPVRHYETTKETAGELGAIAFFGEKYGDVVRSSKPGGTRSSSAGARTCAPRRHRPAQDREGRIDRRQPPPHRGRHRHGTDRAAASRGRGARGAGRCAQRARRRCRRRAPASGSTRSRRCATRSRRCVSRRP